MHSYDQNTLTFIEEAAARYKSIDSTVRMRGSLILLWRN